MKNLTGSNPESFGFRKSAICLSVLSCMVLILMSTVVSFAQTQATDLSKAKKEMDDRVRSTLKKNSETIRFMENKGQVDNPDVLYYYESSFGQVFVEKGRIRFVALKDTLVREIEEDEDSPFVDNDEEHAEHEHDADHEEDEAFEEMEHSVAAAHTFSLYLDGSSPAPKIVLGESFETKFNFIYGNESNKWTSGVKASKELTLENIYPGIDLRLYSNEDGTLEFDWIVDPGMDFNQVRMRFEGQDQVSINAEGNLSVGLRFTDIKFDIPESYQVTELGKVPVKMNFTHVTSNIIGFESNQTIDPKFPLVIDPTLSWGSFMDLNNANFDAYLFAIQVDPVDGTVYCAGGINRTINGGAAPYNADGYKNNITGLTAATGANPLPMATVVYRINSSGSTILDMTMYGPDAVSGGNEVVAHGLSLSTNNVFISGVTNVDIPTTGSPFDASRSSGDGFVAVFPKNLGSLTYATYLGGTGNETLGANSIRAITDNSFVVGMTANASLGTAYVPASGMAQSTFGGGSDMYIAKFSTFNVRTWGTYVGGAGNEVCNDIEVFADGRVAFAGYGTGQLTEVNSAAGRSTGTDNNDGILGILVSAGTSFNYLDELGGAGEDRIFDCDIAGTVLYWTGAVATGFPVSASGVYDISYNGGTSDVVVGKVGETGGSGAYAATYYGTSSEDLGNGIQLVSTVNCAGATNTFLLVFGTVGGSGLPIVNPGSEPFIDSTFTSGGNTGLDMFFAGFNSPLSTLTFSTYMGGSADDYLGNTGEPRGSNHLWVDNASVFLGTTTHSATHKPVLVANGFDTGKSNTDNDAHLIIAVQFPSLVESDFGDAPSTYGAPAHSLNCTQLKIGTLLDADVSAFSTALANGDDNNGIDDEDGITTLPAFSDGAGQNISVTVVNLNNSTGTTANLYGWIDFNSNGTFEANEFASNTVPTGSVNVSRTLTWTGITVSGLAYKHYLRIRLTTNTLNDNAGTTGVDERSTVTASNGEVEDYRAASLTCPSSLSTTACDQAAANAAFTTWINSAKRGGGCVDSTFTAPGSAPNFCGGATTVTFSYATGCTSTLTCMSTFTLTNPGPVINTCAAPRAIIGCNSGAITTPPFSATSAASTEAVFESAPNSGNTSDNCGISTVTYKDVSSGTCPITVIRTWTISDACGSSSTCNQTITITDNVAPTIVTCATNRTIDGCGTSDPQLIPPFSTSLATSSETVFESAPNNGNTSDACGVSTVMYNDVSSGTCPIVITRRWTVRDACGNSATCNQSITIRDITVPNIVACAVPIIIDGCSTAAITTPPFNTATTASTEAVFESTPNNGNVSDNCTSPVSVTYRDVSTGTCPIVVTRRWTVSDACGNTATCNQTITVRDITPPVITSGTIATCYPTVAAAQAAALAATSATDNCTAVTETVGTVGTCNAVVTVTETDACGNSSTQPYNTSIDNSGPTISTCAVGRIIDGCSTADISSPPFSGSTVASSLAVFTGAPNSGAASDACGISSVTYSDVASGTCPIIVIRRWTVSDVCGNTATCNQTITVRDITPPNIVACAVPLTIDGCSTAAITTPPFNTNTTASTEAVFESSPNNGNTSDNCTSPVSVTYRDVASGTCPIVVIRRWTVSDACGNTATCNQTITVRDIIPPVITSGTIATCYPTIAAAEAAALAATSGSDNCSAVTEMASTAGTCNAVVTVTETDACLNSATKTYNTTIDGTGPSISSCAAGRSINGCSTADITSPAFSGSTVATTLSIFTSAPNSGVASDACGITTVTYSDVAMGSCPIVVTRRWTIGDACGNTSTCNQTITVSDVTPPVITSCAVARTIDGCSTAAIANPPFSTTPVASTESVFETTPNSGSTSDNCTSPLNVTYVDVANGTCPIVVTRRWTISDACGNTATCNQTITVRDVTPPVVTTCAAARIIDGCSTAAIISPPFSTTPVASTEAVFETTPNSGNTSDNCTSPVNVLYVDVANGTCPIVVTRRWTISDACGNSATCDQTITVRDVTSPVIATCAAARLIDGCSTAAITSPPFSTTPVASTEAVFETSPNSGNTSDNCTSPVNVTYQDVANGTCPIVVTRRWTISDACGNSATCNQTITVRDVTPPVITTCAAARIIDGCSTAAIVTPPFSATAVASTEAVFETTPNSGNTSDNCTSPLNVTYQDVANGTCPIVVTRRWTISDACGNSATCNQTITVRDITLPVIVTCAAPRIIEGCNTGAITTPPFSLTTAASTEAVFETSPNSGNTSDNCTSPVNVTYRDVATGSCPILVTRTWTISDACGNSATCNQSITVRDMTPPVCQSQNITVNVNPITGLASITAAQVNNGSFDACSAVTLSVTPSSFSCANSGANVVVLTVTDACGNTSTCPATVTVSGCIDLSITKNVSYNAMTNVATFTVGVLNSGPSAATGIEVTDLLPNGYTYTGSSATQGTYASGTGLWLVGNLALSGTATLTITATVNPGIGLNYLNRAQITEDQQYDIDSDPEVDYTTDDLADGITDDDEASAGLGTADLSLTKTAGAYNPANNQIVFTISVLNSGPTGATNVKVTDVLPNGYTYVGSTPSQGTYTNGTGLWNIGSMNNGASVTLTITATVNTGIGLNYTNRAEITDVDQPDPDSNPHTGPTIDEDGDNNGDDDDEDNVTPPIADLSITKTAGVYNPITNQLVFTVTVLNSGPNTATNVRVTDQLPNGYTFVSNTTSQGGYVSGTGLWTVGTLNNGASATLTITVTVNTGGSRIYANAAQVTNSDQFDPDSSPSTGPTVDEDHDGNGDDDDEDVVTPPIADLSVTKAAGAYNAATNQLIFTVTVLNSGPNTATNVAVTDQLPNGYTYVSNTTSQGAFVSGTGLWTVGTLNNGASATLTLTVTLNTGIGLVYLNATQVTASDQLDPDSTPRTGPTVDEDGDANGDDDDEDSALPPMADLSITKTAGVYNPITNQLVFTVTVLNSGPNTATNVRVTDQLPNGYTFVNSSSSQGGYVSGTGLWTVGTLNNGASATLTLTVTLNTGIGLVYTNAAQVSNSDQFDPDSSPSTGPTVDEDHDGNGDDDDEDNVTPQIADLSITKTAGVYNPATNQLVFTVTVLNSGPNTATNVKVTDQLPGGYTYVTNSTSQGSFVSGTGIWTVGTLNNGASATMTLTVTVRSGVGLNYLNTTQVTDSDQIDPDSNPHTGPTVDEDHDGNGDDDDEDSAFPPIADLSLTKTAGVYNPATNQLIFTITVLNSGPNTATNVKVTDQLPNGYTYVTNSTSQGAFVSGTGIWSVGTLNNGASATLTLTVTYNTGIGLNYNNAAQVTDSDQIDPDSNPHTGPTIDEDNDGNGDDDDEDNVTPPIADLSITKTAGTFNPVTNQLIFTVAVTNSGPNTATNVKVTDQLPNGYTYVTNSTSQGTFVSGTGLWTVGSLNNGATATLTLTVTVNTGIGLNYLNTVQVTDSDQPDPDSNPHTGPTVDEDHDGNGDDDDEDSALPPIADLSITKTAGTYNPATNQLVFTVVVLNSGPNTATNVKVTDQLPNGYTYVSNTTSQGTFVSGTGIWSVGTLINGANATLTLTVTLNTGVGLIYNNAAQVTDSDQIDPDSDPQTGPTIDEDHDGNGDDDDEDNVTPPFADLSLTKTAGIYNPLTNQLIFTITVLNSGPNAATNVKVTDQLPNGYTLVTNATSQGTFNTMTGVWTVGTLNNGANATLTLTVTVNTGIGLNYVNAAQVTDSDQPDPDSNPHMGPMMDEDHDGNPDDDDEDNVKPPIADLSLTKTVGAYNPATRQYVFTISVLNSGPDNATNVKVTDILPNGYTYIGNSPSQGTYVSGTGIWSVGNLNNGASASLTITVRVNAGIGLNYLNRAEITDSDQIDPDSNPHTGPTVDEDHDGNGDDDDEDSVKPIIADLSITKTAGAYNPNTNQVIFTLSVLNSGPDNATNVTVLDQLPNAYTFVGSTPSQGAYNSMTGVWTIGSLNNGASASLTITANVLVGSGLNYLNTAQINHSDQDDPDSNPNTGPTVDEDGDSNGDDDDEDNARPLLADLSLTKTAGIFNPVNNQLVFTLTILNSGPDGATNVRVLDQLPNAYTFVGSTPSQGTYNAGTGFWTVGSLLNGASASLTITVTVNTGIALNFTNAAQITDSDQIDPDSSPDTGPTVDENGDGNGDDDDEDNATPVIADLSLTKSIASYNAINNQVTFNVTVLNSGPNNATSIQVTDQLPNGFTYVSSSATQGVYSNMTNLWGVGNLNVGASATLTIIATVNNGVGLNYTNAAQITNQDQIDPDSSPDTGPLVDEDHDGNGDDDDEDNVTFQIADLSLTKTVDDNTPDQNSNIVYTITVTNSGPNNTTGVTARDILPAGVMYVSNIASAGTYNNITGIWTIGALNVGQSQTLQITVTVTGSGVITNSAEITNSNLPDPDSNPNQTFNQDDLGDGLADDDEASVPVTVNCGTCNVISGPTGPVCPGTGSVFNAQIVGLCNNPVYQWTVTGNVQSFTPNGASVTVIAGPICGQPYTVSLSILCQSCGTSPVTCFTTVLVQDAIPPTIVSCASNRAIQGCSLGFIADPPYSTSMAASSEDEFESVLNQGNVSDNCTIASVKYIDASSGACPTVVTRKWTISDACGNSATCIQTITINDTTLPVINACAVTRNIEGCNTSVITGPAYSETTTTSSELVFESTPNNGNVTDNCSIVSVTYRDVSTGQCPIVVTRRWTVMDACGNTATCNQTINVRDTTTPFFTFCPSNTTIDCPATPSFATATASDLCTANVVVNFADVTTPGNCPGNYSTRRTWTATDNCGNSATCFATITVRDITPPQLMCPAPLILNCDATTNYPAVISAWIATATATDACDGSVTITNNWDGMTIPAFACEGGIAVTFTATDDCGNTAVCTSLITKPCFNVETAVYLEGSAVNPNGGSAYTLPMRTSLNDLHVLPGQLLVDPFFGNKYTPAGQPYAQAPWNYFGNEGSLFDSGSNPNNSTAGYPVTAVDWVLVSLRLDSAGTVGPVCQSAALLHKDGTIQFVKPLNCCQVNEAIPYYIVIEHRNHLIIMSNNKASFVNHKLIYDFRFQQSYEDPLFAGLNLYARQKEIQTGKFAMYAGNGDQKLSNNADTDITFDDRSYWESQNGAVGQYRIGDYNLNGDTNFNDRIVWERNNGKFTSVPRN